MSRRSNGEPRLLFPALRSFYAALAPYRYPLLRVTAGAILFLHGWAKIMSGTIPSAAIDKLGFAFAQPLGYFVVFLETIGAICIMLGLFTRFFAAAIAIEMAVLVIYHWPAGYSASRGGYEFVLLWGVVFLIIALAGGGRYSLDRKLGTEL